MISTVDSLLTWALDGIANVSMFLKLSVGELNFNVLFKTLHTHAVLGLTVEHHHQITAGKCTMCTPCQLFRYRIADYFHGVLIFVIFVANPGVTKFSTHKIFTRTLVQVCEHQRSSCFVDVVASHARLDTEALHLSSSLTYPDAYW